MPWVRLDEQFPDHPKVAIAGPLAGWLHVCALAYCNRLLTDGFVPSAQVGKLADFSEIDPGEGHPVSGIDLADRLVEVGMWERARGGYLIHDFLDYQPSKAEVEAQRKARATAGKAGGLASARARAEARADEAASKRPSKSPSTCLDDRTNGVGNEGVNETSTDSNPVPSRPVPISQLRASPSAQTKAHTLPDDFAVSAEMLAWAGSEGLGALVSAETAKFRDYWVAQGGQRGRKTDWVATWRNWLRKAGEDRAPTNGNGHTSRAPFARDPNGPAA